VEAPNPIFPELNEIIWGGAAFLILLVVMVKKGFPAVKGAMDARAERIQTDLDAAETAKSDAQAIQADYEARLADAKGEAARLFEEARATADQLRVDLEARFEAEDVERRVRATADIEAKGQQAIADLRVQVADIALGAAERVVHSSLDEDAQRRLIDQYIDEVSGHDD
jgi:F-type H+-transporting ATPase subunit b